jgi:hypothetical protein
MSEYSADDLKSYYSDLLLYQYADKPKAIDTIKTLVDCAVIDVLPMYVNDAFDIDTAEGNQLDIIGEYIGFNRYIPNQIPRPYYNFDDYTGSPIDLVGYRDYIDQNINADSVYYLYIFSNTSFNRLDDTEYRPLLKLKSILNRVSNTYYEINTLLFDFFQNNVICCDQTDMTMSYFVLTSASRITQIAYEQGLLPKPMAVGISGIFSVDDPLAIFSLSDYTWDNGAINGFSGYDTGLSGMIFLNYKNKVV